MERESDSLAASEESLTRNYSGRGQFEVPPPQNATEFQWPHFLAGQHAKPVRVVLVASDPLIRNVIAQELLDDRRIQLEKANTLREGRCLLIRHELDVLMVDVCLVDGSGFELITEAKKHRSTPEVIAISAHLDEAQALHAFELGASGYLVQSAWLQSYAQAVLHVVNGGAAVTPTLARRLLVHLNHSRANGNPVRSPTGRATLTARELEVLQLVALGNGGDAIAKQLGISPQTVNVHIKSIYRKLQVHTRAQAVSCATHRGLL